MAPEGTTLYIGPHFEAFLPATTPPPGPGPTPQPGLNYHAHLPLVRNWGLSVNGQTALITKYYFLNGQRIAQRAGSAGPVVYFYRDNLGSTLATSAGDATRYWPFGGARGGGLTSTAYRFTGQLYDPAAGLYFYKARFYEPAIGRFLSPDPLVQTDAKSPQPYWPLTVSYANPQFLDQWNRLQRAQRSGAPGSELPAPTDPQLMNRYAYARNNPLVYTDDSGNVIWWLVGGAAGAVIGFGAYAITHRDNFQWGEAALWTGGGALVGATFGAGAQLVAGALSTEAAATTVGMATTAGVAGGQQTLSYFSRAAEFGIRSYAELRTLIAGTGLQAHHLIEQRFAAILDLDTDAIPSVALTLQEHQVFTNAWRAAIGYVNSSNAINTATATAVDVWAAAQRIYADFPELLEVVRQALSGR